MNNYEILLGNLLAHAAPDVPLAVIQKAILEDNTGKSRETVDAMLLGPFGAVSIDAGCDCQGIDGYKAAGNEIIELLDNAPILEDYTKDQVRAVVADRKATIKCIEAALASLDIPGDNPLAGLVNLLESLGFKPVVLKGSE